jgi:hypothetical protein
MIYMSFGININERVVVALCSHKDRKSCESISEELVKKYGCTEYRIFIFINFREEFDHWLSECGLTKLEITNVVTEFYNLFERK